jgi:hypothetical protein
VLLRRGRILESVTLGWNMAGPWCWPWRRSVWLPLPVWLTILPILREIPQRRALPDQNLWYSTIRQPWAARWPSPPSRASAVTHSPWRREVAMHGEQHDASSVTRQLSSRRPAQLACWWPLAWPIPRSDPAGC